MQNSLCSFISILKICQPASSSNFEEKLTKCAIELENWAVRFFSKHLRIYLQWDDDKYNLGERGWKIKCQVIFTKYILQNIFKLKMMKNIIKERGGGR